MRDLSVWILEFTKLFGRQELHPLKAECPICRQSPSARFGDIC